MGSVFAAMVSTAEAMRVMQRSLTIVENNIVNASTPGYARQQASLVAAPFNPNSQSTSGGVQSGPMESTRSASVESSVWKLQHNAGFAGSLRLKLSELERTFPLTEGAGLSAELDRFFNSVSQWSVSPNSPTARGQVLNRATKIAQAFNQTSLDLANAGARATTELGQTVDTINRLARDIVAINNQKRENFASSNDAGLDSRLHAKLEALSEIVNFTALPQEDGSVSIMIGGQTPLVIGNTSFKVSLTQNASGANRVLDSTGVDITDRLDGGRIAGLVEFQNTLVPDYRTRLNALAKGFADGVNGVLAAGIDQNGNPPAQNLFTYNATVGEAVTIAVTSITTAQLAAAAPGDPGGNTNALNLADLQRSPIVGGLTPAQFYAEITAAVGDRLNAVKSDVDLQQNLLLQAQNLRAELSGVDISVEATKLLQLQKGFQAAGQVMSVLNSLNETVLGMLR